MSLSYELSIFSRLYNEGVIDSDVMDEALNAYLEIYMERMIRRCCREKFGTFTVDRMSDDEVFFMFTFKKEHLQLLLDLLEIPTEIVLRGRRRIPGITAISVLLRRLTYTNSLSDLEPIFGMPTSYLTAVVNHMLHLVLERKGNLLEDMRNLRWINEEKLSHYAEAIHGKGAALKNCWGFIDSPARRICKPSANHGKYYSAQDGFHSLKYQSIITPDGMIVSLKGSYPGRSSNEGIMNASNVEEELIDVSILPNRRYFLYGDEQYELSNLFITPYNHPQEERPREAAFNRSMSLVQTPAQGGLGKVIRLFAHLDFSKNPQLTLLDLAKVYKVAVLLSNCHTCLYGSQVDSFFETIPPTLQEYLGPVF